MCRSGTDMTYICVGYDFNYLSLVTDAYSKKIVGYCLHQFLSTEGCLKALEMALATGSKIENNLTSLTGECNTVALSM